MQCFSKTISVKHNFVMHFISYAVFFRKLHSALYNILQKSSFEESGQT